jgi:hypothetical protein
VGKKYDFTYDDMNRLTTANFLQNTTGSAWVKIPSSLTAKFLIRLTTSGIDIQVFLWSIENGIE